MNPSFEKILFPLSSKYNEDWIRRNSLGENVLYNLESLCEVLELKPGMKVLDLGCGKAVSAIFLAREFGVSVWAVDPNVSATENYMRIAEMGCEDKVFPLRLHARDLPFPREFFDVIIAVDSYMYFGTDEEFTLYISGFLKPEGQIGLVDICYSRDVSYLNEISDPELLNKENLNFVHSLNWWYKLWNSSGLLRILNADIVPQNNFIRDEYIRDYLASNKKDIIAEELISDNEKSINIFRMVARKSLPVLKDYLWENEAQF